MWSGGSICLLPRSTAAPSEEQAQVLDKGVAQNTLQKYKVVQNRLVAPSYGHMC